MPKTYGLHTVHYNCNLDGTKNIALEFDPLVNLSNQRYHAKLVELITQKLHLQKTDISVLNTDLILIDVGLADKADTNALQLVAKNFKAQFKEFHNLTNIFRSIRM